jgi:effector-binding domain-containing protein
VRRGIAATELISWAAGVFGSIAAHLQRINVPTTGEPFVLYLERGEHCEVEAGFPVAERITPKDEVRSSSLPGGPAITTWHQGHPDDLGDAFEAIDAWLQRQAAEATGPAWVIHHADPDAEPGAASWMSEVVQPYRD